LGSRRRAVQVAQGLCLLMSLCVVLTAALMFRQLQTIERFFEFSRSGQVLDRSVQGPVSGYYVDFSARYRENHPFDMRGLPLIVRDGEKHYHPVTISEFALGAYEEYLKSGDTTARRKFLICADWLKDNLKRRGEFDYWEYTFPLPTARVPWVSGLAQGEGVSVLLRAYVATGEYAYLEAASKAIKPIFYDVSVGGSSIVKGSHYVFPQEYPSQPKRENVLNGAIAAYLGVHDYYRVTKDPYVQATAQTIRTTLRNSLQDFDVGYWSLYSQPPPSLASPHYQIQHVRLLRVLYEISGDGAFLDFAERFERQRRDSRNILKYIVVSHLARMRELRIEELPMVPQKLWRVVAGRNF
jgi:heparosan-N-sulfate-glucuronate 5-epimerase